jgi:WD40 repeat protein
VRFNSAGTELLTISGQSQIQVINLKSRAVVRTICCSSIYGEVAFGSDDVSILNAGHWPRVWDKYGRPLAYLTKYRQDPTFGPIAIDHEKQEMFMGSQDGRVYAWDLRHYNLLARSKPHDEYVRTIAILPAKSHEIAYAGLKTTVKLWNPETGQESELPELKPNSNLIVLPDGHSLLFGTAKGTLETWDIATRGAGTHARRVATHRDLPKRLMR